MFNIPVKQILEQCAYYNMLTINAYYYIYYSHVRFSSENALRALFVILSQWQMKFEICWRKKKAINLHNYTLKFS